MKSTHTATLNNMKLYTGSYQKQKIVQQTGEEYFAQLKEMCMIPPNFGDIKLNIPKHLHQ